MNSEVPNKISDGKNNDIHDPIYTKYVDLEKKHFELKDDNRKLKYQVDELILENSGLLSDYTKLKINYDNLETSYRALKTPPLISAEVIAIYDDDNLIQVKCSTGQKYIISRGNYKVKIGDHVGLHHQSLCLAYTPTREISSNILIMECVDRPDISYSQIGGLSTQINEIIEVVEWPLLHPEKFKSIGIDPLKGILLYGPPGTGKTLLAKAVAHQTNATFIQLTGSELVKKFIGEGASLVSDLFTYAKQKTPCIIFIDEIDAIASKRVESNSGGEKEVQRTLNQLLTNMSGFDGTEGVIVIGATNRLEDLDPAILRPGRFDKIIEIPLPDSQGQKDILKIYLDKLSINNAVTLDKVYSLFDRNLSGAEIKNICIEAGMSAIRNDRDIVHMIDFEYAVYKICTRLNAPVDSLTAKLLNDNIDSLYG